MEKEYKDLSPIAKKGLNKFAGLPSVKCMQKYGEEYRNKTGRNSYNISLKEDFFKFVAKHRIKC